MRMRLILFTKSCKLFTSILHTIRITQARHKNNLSLDDIPDIVSSVTIKRTLKGVGANFEDGYTNFKTTCPFCIQRLQKNVVTEPLFINKTTGFFICGCMQLSGQWTQIENCFGVKKGAKMQKDLAEVKETLSKLDTTPVDWDNIVKTTESLATQNEEELAMLSQKLDISVLQDFVITMLSIRIDKAKKYLYFPLYGIGNNITGYKKLNIKTKEECTVPTMGCSGISHSKPSKISTTALLVPSILDILVLAQMKLSVNVICLPHGLSNLPQQVLPYLEPFNKIILWFGNQIHSWDVARNFAKKLLEQRCFFVRPIDTQPVPHLVPVPHDVKKILANAQPIWHKAITTFSSLRHDVLCDLQNIDRVQGIKWKRYPTLNRILRGHRRGELTVLTGPTGCGKTTFMSEYSLDLAMQGVNTLWGSFEIRNARLARTMLQQMAGIPLDDNLQHFDYWADQFELLPVYFMTFHGQQPVKVVMEAVEHATYVHDIAHVIIDNVQFMMGMGDEAKHMDRFWKQDVIVAAFRTFATKKNCHVTLVIHPRKERDTEDLTTSSIFGGAKASQEADNVLLIQDKRLTSVRGKKYLQVAKNRYSGDLGIMTLDFDKSSLSYGQRKKKTEEKPLDSNVIEKEAT